MSYPSEVHILRNNLGSSLLNFKESTYVNPLRSMESEIESLKNLEIAELRLELVFHS